MTGPRTVLITGAPRGIGRACALGLAARGWHVFAGVRGEPDGRSLVEATGDRLIPIALDVTDPAQVAGAASTVERAVGDRGLDGLVNSAGIAVAGPLAFLPLADFRAQLETNVVGMLAVTQAMLGPIRRARGRVVMIGSLSGRVGFPLIDAGLATARGTMGDALPVLAVVRQVAHAPESRRPKTRYLTVRAGWAYRLATSLTPGRWRDAVVRRVLAHYRDRTPA